MQRIDEERIAYTMRKLMDKGHIIESGWMAYRASMSPTAPPVQLRECRLAFWHGCSFLFQAIMFGLEPGKMETPADLRRMDNIDAELRKFEELCQRMRGSTDLSYTCCRCGAISYNLTDIKQGYCGACHDWTR